jgi:heme a synthase
LNAQASKPVPSSSTPIGRLERWRSRALEVDAADAESLRDARVASRVRRIAGWDRIRFRRSFGGLGAAFVVLQVLSRFGSPVVRASIGGVATLVAIVASFVFIGRWVRMSPRTFHRIAIVSAVLLAFIILTGAAVRLTGSGLGCPTWPNCTEGSLTSTFGESSHHDDIEFANRIVTGFVVIAAGVGVLGAVARRPYRRDLTQLGWIVVALIMGNAVLGGLVVLFHLKPQIVMGHFALAIASLAVGVVIVARSRESAASSLLGRERRVALNAVSVALGRAMTAAAAVVIFLGTIVTGSGPHGGDPDVERFALSMRDTTRWHSVAVWMLLAVTVALAVTMQRRANTAAGREALRRVTVLLAVIVVQGGIGYFQYFNQVPAGLVMAHIVGAVSVWVAVLRVRAALTIPGLRGAAPIKGRASRDAGCVEVVIRVESPLR